MRYFLSLSLLTLLIFSLSVSGFSQSSPENNENYPAVAVEHATVLYNSLMLKQSHLYNGGEYVGFDRSIKGHQYFESEDWEEGNIFYDGQLYRQVFLRYDLYNDAVVTEHFDRHGYYTKVQLIGEKIDFFELLGHHFVHIEPDSADQTILRAGFYDLLYDGNVKVIVKRIKEIQQSSSSFELREEFRERNKIFIQKEERYFGVKSKHSVIKVFKEKKKELRRYARRNQLDFRNNRENSIVKLTAYYEHLNRTE